MEKNVMDAEWNVSAKRYTGGKILVGSLPGVEIGSTIEVEVGNRLLESTLPRRF